MYAGLRILVSSKGCSSGFAAMLSEAGVAQLSIKHSSSPQQSKSDFTLAGEADRSGRFVTDMWLCVACAVSNADTVTGSADGAFSEEHASANDAAP